MPRALGLMSGSSLDGLDIVCADFASHGEHPTEAWSFDIVHAETMPYSLEWVERLSTATDLDARAYLLLHSAYGHYLGQCVNQFLAKFAIDAASVDLVASHGHTVFHEPWNGMTGQIGDGAAIAAETRLQVVSDLRAMDVAHGGQGAPIVPIGEKYLLGQYRLLLNIGGIANVTDQKYRVAFDICPANRVLNKLVHEHFQKDFDEDGQLASQGTVNTALLDELNRLDFYQKTYPKSLSNSFGLDVVYPLVSAGTIPVHDRLRTYVEHIVTQIGNAIEMIVEKEHGDASTTYDNCKMLITGGGAHNRFLFQCLATALKARFGIDAEYPDVQVVNFKEALIMALMGLLRVQKTVNVLASVTGARQDSIGGALWSH